MNQISEAVLELTQIELLGKQEKVFGNRQNSGMESYSYTSNKINLNLSLNLPNFYSHYHIISC